MSAGNRVDPSLVRRSDYDCHLYLYLRKPKAPSWDKQTLCRGQGASLPCDPPTLIQPIPHCTMPTDHKPTSEQVRIGRGKHLRGWVETVAHGKDGRMRTWDGAEGKWQAERAGWARPGSSSPPRFFGCSCRGLAFA